MRNIREIEFGQKLQQTAWGYRGLEFAEFEYQNKRYMFRPYGKIKQPLSQEKPLKYHAILHRQAKENGAKLLVSVWFIKNSQALAIGRAKPLREFDPEFHDLVHFDGRKRTGI